MSELKPALRETAKTVPDNTRRTRRARFRDAPWALLSVSVVGASLMLAPAPCSAADLLLDSVFCMTAAANRQQTPAVAFNGENYLVVWTDARAGSQDIYAARVDTNGALLDSAGIPVSRAPWDQQGPDVVWGDSCFFVVWKNLVHNQGDIYGARISRDGRVLDSGGIAISSDADGEAGPKVAWGDGEYLVTWYTLDVNDIYAARVSASGVVLDTARLPVCTLPYSQYDVDVDYDDTNFAVFWYDNYRWHICGNRIRPDGTILDSAGFIVSEWYGSGLSNVAVAFGESVYVVTWQLQNSQILATRVSRSGARLDSSDIEVSPYGGTTVSPSICFDGTNFVVVWNNGADYGRRLRPTGELLDTLPFVLPAAGAYQGDPAVAGVGDDYLVTWTVAQQYSEVDIGAGRYTGAGVPLDSGATIVSTSANQQRSVRTASSDSLSLVVWEDRRSAGVPEIRGMRIDQAGNVLDPDGIPVAWSLGIGNTAPAVAHGDSCFLVAWQMWSAGPSGCDIYGRRVSNAGVFLDSQPIPIAIAAGAQLEPAVAFDGRYWLVVWRDQRNGGDDKVYGSRVTTDGTVLDPAGMRLCFGGGDCFDPTVAGGDSGWLVSWRDTRGPWDIFAARVSRDGALLDSVGLAVCVNAQVQTNPTVAYDDSLFLVAWEDYRANGYNPDVYAARVTWSGNVLDPDGIGLALEPHGQGFPAVVGECPGFYVVWQDERNNYDHIYGARVNRSGAVADSFLVTLAEGDQLEPSVTRLAGGRHLVAYSGWTGTVGTRRVNAQRSWCTLLEPVGIETKPGGDTRADRSLAVTPSPSRGAVTISIVAGRSHPGVTVYDCTGRVVCHLVANSGVVGQWQAVWFGTDERGVPVPAGCYVCRVTTENRTLSRLIVRLNPR